MRVHAAALAFLMVGSAVFAQSDLEKRVRDLEIRMSGDGGPAEAKAGGDGVPLSFWFDDGLRFGSGDGNFEGRIGAYVIQHSVFYPKENERDSVDTFTIRDAGVDMGARLWKTWEVFVSAQILPDEANLYYGWVEFNRWEELKLRAGKFKEPYSREELEHRLWGDFLELSLVDGLIPGRQIGAMAFGALGDGLFRYWLGVFNGDSQDTNADENSDKDVCGRVELVPGAAIDSEILQKLFLAVSVEHGRQRKDLNVAPIGLGVESTGTEYLSPPAGLSSDFRTDGDRTGVEADFAWCPWQLEFKSEVHYFRQEMEFSDRKDTFNAYAFSSSLGFWIGGRRTPLLRPEIDKPLFDGGFGGIQIVARYSQIYVGSELQDHAGFTGTNRVREYAACVNWYPNEHVRISVMYANIEYGSERVVLSGGTSVDDENVWIFRTQIDF